MRNLWLSPYGIWYFRKVYLLPSGKRKEIRKSLRTRDKREANERVIKLLACNYSVPKDNSIEPSHAHQHREKVLTTKHLLSHLDSYLIFKSRHCAEREVSTIRRFIFRYVDFLSNNDELSPDSSLAASQFLDSLQVAVPTKNKHASKVGAFLQWLDKRSDFNIKNPFADLKERYLVAPMVQRQAYTQNQANMLVRLSQEIVDWKKWIILLGRYTGMRCNEICQLHHDDIILQDGVWYISVNLNHSYKRLKTSSSSRLIPLPIHQLDHFDCNKFLEFVSFRKERLFPEAKIYKGNCAYYFGKWFNRWRKSYSLPEFHSLRHLVATELKSEGVAEQFAAAFLGHSTKGITFNRYGKTVTNISLINVGSIIG